MFLCRVRFFKLGSLLIILKVTIVWHFGLFENLVFWLQGILCSPSQWPSQEFKKGQHYFTVLWNTSQFIIQVTIFLLSLFWLNYKFLNESFFLSEETDSCLVLWNIIIIDIEFEPWLCLFTSYVTLEKLLHSWKLLFLPLKGKINILCGGCEN